MGICCFPRNNFIFRVDTITNNIHTNRYNFNENCEKFNDMPLTQKEIYINYGIKKMRAYKCTLNIDELNNLREHFWSVKISLNERYRFLRQAILYDSDKCEEYLSKNGFYTLEGCINNCSDFTKYIYNIPNYCINDPYFEKILLNVDNNRQPIDLKIYLKYNDQCELFNINDHYTGKMLKDEYYELQNKKNKNNFLKIRLFFGGNEIKDDEYLYQHKIYNNYYIQFTPVYIFI